MSKASDLTVFMSILEAGMASLTVKPPTKQEMAWEDVVKALRHYYLQGNSHIDSIEETIDKWIVATLNEIRKTGKKKLTVKMVSRVEGRDNTRAPRCLAH